MPNCKVPIRVQDLHTYIYTNAITQNASDIDNYCRNLV